MIQQLLFNCYECFAEVSQSFISTFSSNTIDTYLTFFKSVFFSGLIGEFTDPAFPDIFFLELEKQTSMECGIAFSPKEVSSAFYYLYYWRAVELK